MEPSQPKSVADSIEDWTKNLDIDSLLSHVDSGLLGGGVLSASEAEMLGSTDFLTGSTLAASDIQYSIDLPTLGDDTVSSSSSWLAGEVMGQASRVLEQPFLPSPPTGAIDIPKGHMGTEQASRDRNTLRSENQTPPKIGKRFSSGTSRILKSWLADHIHQPYPTFQDVQLIQQQTGLTRQQIVTWFRNARRYRKAQGTPSQWPIARQMDDVEPEDTANALEQPLPFHDMSPLQRWQNSPPEHEPATASAIAQASSQIQSRPLSRAPTPIDKAAFTRSWRDDSSASSAATSQLSNSSLGSAWSGESRLRCPELKPKKVKRRKRRRPLVFKPETGRCSSLNPVCHTFQCTFCTETFATKHNWQRHEKSLHLSLEQWECSPQGPIFQNANSEPACTYCGQPNPAHDHLMAHNYAFCHKRSAEERLFSRKDHLQQHLKLVHEASFVQVPMEQWKRQAQTLRSRCGFCDITMDTWADRADHLADHFKKGKSMADWKGDWGFEGHVLSIVENSMPPYLIHDERNSPWPFTTQQGPVETPVNAFELIKLELDYWMSHENTEKGLPSVKELQFESCCIILGSEISSQRSGEPGISWLRDLLMSSPETVSQARLHPTKTSLKARITQLRIQGKRNIFEGCTAEAKLHEFVDSSKAEGSVPGSVDLQLEASRIISFLESVSPAPSGIFARFLNDLIFTSTRWLLPFRARAALRRGEIMPDVESLGELPEGGPSVGGAMQPLDDPDIVGDAVNNCISSHDTATKNMAPSFQNDSNCYRRLARELSRFVCSALSPHNPARYTPSDEALQHQARWIMFEEQVHPQIPYGYFPLHEDGRG